MPRTSLLDSKHARRVIQLLADVFADALELAAAGALGVFGLMANDGAWKLRWQGHTFRGLPWFGLWRSWEKLFQLGLDSLKVGVEQVIQQAALRRADLLAALGELVAFEQGDFELELFDEDSIVLNLPAHRLDLDCNCNACAAKSRSCSGVIWSRLGEKVMPPIVPEQAWGDDK